jgi:hypothetical protein
MSIAVILMFPQSVSVGASSQAQVLHIPNEEHVITPSDNKHNNKAMDWTFDWSFDNTVHHSHNQSDDDNKSHHFHYNRFSKNRKRILVNILLKILLIITHVSSIAYASIHILH